MPEKKSSQPDLITHFEEMGSGLGDVRGKRMFGGHGLFHEGLMFAIVDEGVLYFKADAENESAFEERGLPRFSYLRKGKKMHLSYRRAPEEALENPRAFKKWARLAIEAAKRKKRKR